MNQRDELDELLSAYFDGELVNDEPSRVRAALAENDDNQRVVEELEVLHASIEEFPRNRLGADFKTKVLAEIAERGPRRQDRPIKRQIVTAVAVLAAALLVMWIVVSRLNTNPDGRTVTQPNETKDGGLKPVPVAKKPKQDPKDGKTNDPIGKQKSAIAKSDPDKTPKKNDKGVPKKALAKNGKKKPAAVLGKYVMTIELVVTEKGFREQTFERVMDAHQITYKPSLKLKVAKSLEEQLLASRFLKDVTSRKREANKRDQVQLVYVLMDPARLDRMWMDLRTTPSHISELKINMAITTKEFKIFDELKRSEAMNFAALVKQKKALAAQVHRARQLMVGLSLMSNLTRTVATTGKIGVENPQPKKKGFAKSRSVGKSKRGPLFNLMGRGKTAQVLFILHRAADKDAKKKKKK